MTIGTIDRTIIINWLSLTASSASFLLEFNTINEDSNEFSKVPDILDRIVEFDGSGDVLLLLLAKVLT